MRLVVFVAGGIRGRVAVGRPIVATSVNRTRTRMYREAISFYEKALTLSTRSLSTYSCLAYTYHLQGNYFVAVMYYHKALGLKPDDQFCREMLTLALADESRCGLDSILNLPFV